MVSCLPVSVPLMEEKLWFICKDVFCLSSNIPTEVCVHAVNLFWGTYKISGKWESCDWQEDKSSLQPSALK